MNFDFSPEENAFREEVRQFIADNYPQHLTKAVEESLPRKIFYHGIVFLPKKAGSRRAGRKNLVAPVGR